MKRFEGYLYILIAVGCWGGSASLAKYLFSVRYDTLIISQTRSSLSFLLLALFFGLTRRGMFRVQRKDVYKFALVGVIGVAGSNFCYYYTVQEASVATAILLQYTAPVLVALFAALISREEEITVAKFLSLVLAIFGCYLAVSGGKSSSVSLSGWAFVTGPASALCYAYMILASKRLLRTYSVWTMLVYAFGFATVFWLLVNPAWNIMAAHYTPGDWGVFLLFAVVSILIPHSFFSMSLKLLEATTVGIVTFMEPVVAIVVAYLTLGERLGGIQFVGGAGVLAAVGLLQIPPKVYLKARAASKK